MNVKNSEIGAFSNVTEMENTWQKVLSQGTRFVKPKGAEILRCGEKWNTLNYVEVGEVHLLRTLPDGRERLLWIGTAPCFVGEGPFFDNLPASSHIIASKACVIYTFSHSWVTNILLPKYPELVLTLMHSMAKKLRVLTNQSVCLTMDDIPILICQYLYSKLDTENNAGNIVSTGLNQQDFANLLGVHRVSLSRALRSLEKQGILAPYLDRKTRILNMDLFLKLINS